MRLYARFGKRLLDLTLAIPTMIVGAPVFLLVAVLVRIKLGSPVIFRQERPGWHERPFTMVKFRSMLDERDADGNQRTEMERHTSFGRKLRGTSLDELPELWNVLRGDMSLVGPRPLLVEFLERYTPEEERRHEMRPGITGWAVVHGRQSASFVDRFEHDVWYVDHWSVGLDLRILALTVAQVLRRTDASEAQAMSDIDLPARLEAGLQATTAPTEAPVEEGERP
jgi:sugar transferase EpsL